MLSKNNIPLELKKLFLLFLILCVPLKSLAQELEWVYTIPGVMGENDGDQPSSTVVDIVTNSNDEIYVFGRHTGTHDFGIQTESAEMAGNYRNFIVKLDKDKNVLWVKKIHPFIFYLGYLNRGIIELDANENILIGGNIRTNSVTTTISLDPAYHVFNQVNVHENLLTDTYYGFVLKLDEQGNYINSTLFESIFVEDIVADANNDIVVVGATTEYNVLNLKWLEAYICKLDSNLNFLWDKTYNSNNNPNAFFGVGLDSQNNIYCQGTYLDNFTFGGITLQNPSSEFVCKLLPNGDEDWINELASNPTIYHPTSAPFIYRKIYTDPSDNIYFFSTYSQAPSYQFNNTTISNLPLVDSETVLFKMDINGNHIWNIPLHGIGDQNIIDFSINTFGELTSIVNSSSQNLNYANDSILETNNGSSFLLKTNQQGGLIDFKNLDINPFTLETDTENNIILGGQFKEVADFDPHPFNEFTLHTNSFIYDNNTYYEGVAFVLKLLNCDEEPLFLEHYDFCASATPNPMIADIQPSDFNINWYNSADSQTPLDDDFLITDGAIYYMEKIAESCPALGRQPVQMNILPPPDPPVIESVEPCYYPNMRLSDLNIQGENLVFYDSPTEGNVVSDLISINPNNNYYVTQTINNCESQRIQVNIGNLNLTTKSQTVYVCDNGKDDTEVVNLSDYVSHFTNSLNGISVSYYATSDDASTGTNAIANYQNYQTENNQTFYLRFYSEEFGCFEVVELTIWLSSPPEITELLINDFANNNSITILPYNENYLYSLNGITYQNSNYFENLQGGEYFVYVKNIDESCQPIMDNAFLLSYPKFFTPNGDGFNDYWRIQFSQYQELLNVEIYDRYGTLITFFDKNSTGWDGTFNGNNLPATDYWFKITRISDQKLIYRAHFSLIR